MGRLRELVRKYPPTTLFYTGLCCFFFILSLFGDINDVMCLKPYIMIYGHQIYRLFTAQYAHLGFLHILFNMMSFYSISGQLEPKFGSVLYLYCILLFGLLGNILLILLCYIFNRVFQNILGFSGVIFTLETIECFFDTNEERSLFGIWNVKTKYFPICLLVVMQIFMPNVSFLGHLSGILIGFLYVMGVLDWIIPMKLLKYIESSSCSSLLKKADTFTFIPTYIPSIPDTTTFSQKFKSIYKTIYIVIIAVWKLCKRICLFIYDFVYPDDGIVPSNQPTLRSETTYMLDGDKIESKQTTLVDITQEEIKKKQREILINKLKPYADDF